MNARPGASFWVVLGALLACKSQSAVTGSVSFDGAAFQTKDCQVSEATSTLGGGSVTTHTVTLIDEGKRRLSFSDSGGMRVSFSHRGAFDTIGQGCGKLSFAGSAKAGDARGHVEADCTGGGHTVVANFGFAGCGKYGLGP